MSLLLSLFLFLIFPLTHSFSISFIIIFIFIFLIFPPLFLFSSFFHLYFPPLFSHISPIFLTQLTSWKASKWLLRQNIPLPPEDTLLLKSQKRIQELEALLSMKDDEIKIIRNTRYEDLEPQVILDRVRDAKGTYNKFVKLIYFAFSIFS